MNCGRCAVRADSVHVRHASVEVQVKCVNVVIGLVLGELLVVRVVPLVVCDDAVVRLTLVLIAFTVAIVFIVAILRRILLYWRYSVHTNTVGFAEVRLSAKQPSGGIPLPYPGWRKKTYHSIVAFCFWWRFLKNATVKGFHP